MLGKNARVMHPSFSALNANKLAFREGFADFYSMYSQETDETAPTLEFDPVLHHWSKDMTLWSQSVEEDTNANSAGEDEELTVMRVLWDLIDDAPEDDGGYDQFNTSFRSLIQNYILNENQRPGAAVAGTLSQVWRNLEVLLTHPEDRIDAGAVFDLNNVAPTLINSAAGMYVEGVLTTEWNSLDDIPEFWFLIPKGMVNEPVVAQLLNRFTFIFFNSDYSGPPIRIVATISQTDPNPNWARWTPSPEHWLTITAGMSTKRYVVAGGLQVGNSSYVSGLYWSSANDLNIT